MASSAVDLPAEEVARADVYRLLALLLAAAPDGDLLASLSGVEAEETEFGAAVRTLAALSRSASVEALAEEFGDLFVGVPTPRLMPYGSYYMNGQLFGRSLATLRMELAHMCIARNDDATEPEDHLATLCEIMAGLILGAFGQPPLPLFLQAEFFARHLQPWALRFFEDLAAAEDSRFYMGVAEIGRVFFSLEAEAFRMVER